MSAADKLLWYKAWTETRFYFRIGLAFLTASGVAMYIGYPDDVTKHFPNGGIAVSVEQVRALLYDGHTFIWLSWFGTSLLLGLSILALGLASTGIVRAPDGSASPGVSYLLSMPVSRRRLASVRMAAGVVELAVAAVLPSLLISLLAPAQGVSFPMRQAVAHALLATTGALALYGLFVLLSAALGELAKAVAGGAFLILYGMFTFLTSGVRHYSVFRLMTGDTYFLRGEIPWPGIAVCVAFALASMYASVVVVERRDF